MLCRMKMYPVVMVVALLLMVASYAFAASAQDQGSHHWNSDTNRFSAFGTVVTVDDTNGTLTVSLDGTSRLLRDENGNAFTFQVSDHVRVSAFGGAMGKGGLMANGKMWHHGGHMSLTDVQEKDNIVVSGYLDSTSKDYVATQIVIWLY